jgi:flagellar hook protein FlgE
MIGALWNGVSGLNTFEKALNVESNNTTNVNTVGHKADDITFEDMLYQNGYGKGSQVESITKKMYQGSIKLTGYTYDVAIEGKGYFVVNERNTADIYYTRAGNFQMAEDGLLQTQDGLKVLGLTPQSNTVITSNPDVTQFNNIHEKFIASQTINNENFLQTINARSTDYNKSATDIGVSGDGFKTKSALISDIDALVTDYKSKLELYSSTGTAIPTSSIAQITKIDYSNSLNELSNENDIIKVRINNTEISQKFDTNLETTLNKFSDKISNIQGLSSSIDTQTGILTINSLIPAKEITITNSGINDIYANIENTQNPKLGTGIGIVNSSRDALKNSLELANAQFLDITNTISLATQNSLNLNEIQLKLDNLELSDNTFGEIEIDEGIIFLKDNNNKFVVGKLQTAMFTNEQGLNPQGDNLYKNTAESGRAMYAGDLNKIVSNSLELSTANVGTSLTNLLIYQKAFEANSKSITTSDEMLKTAIELRK